MKALFSTRVALAAAALCASGALLAQTASEGDTPIVPPKACDAPAVVLRVLALERAAPGELRMEVDYESRANVPQSVDLSERKTILVDNTRYQYRVKKSPRETRLLPDQKTRASYVFQAEVGGLDAKTAGMDISFTVRSGSGSRKVCEFVIPAIPIADIKR